ncbi:unnamed protein product [Allacma fusca]|uniref:Uncharacterized protein n=1 Tax=Allacma fusca TaxID=39272 RepID=A0A8J2LMQ8_9HEXA|nr:unnamed protein product [Allacma fusca]
MLFRDGTVVVVTATARVRILGSYFWIPLHNERPYSTEPHFTHELKKGVRICAQGRKINEASQSDEKNIQE